MRISFTEWNARVRIEEAKELLRSVDLSITAISASVGYDDVTTFERVFKRLEGVCPRAHRRRITQNAESATLNAETLPTLR
jgi:YesN/AraC family two-component response regulator